MGLSWTPLGFMCPTLETTIQHPSLRNGTLHPHKKKEWELFIGDLGQRGT